MAPITATIMPIAVAPNGGAKSHAHAKADEGRSRIVVVVHIDNGRIVGWDINNFGAGWLYLDHRICHINNLVLVSPFDNGIGGGHHLLWAGLEFAGGLGLGAQCLNRIHQIHGLLDERFAKLSRPPQVRVHLCDDLGKPGHLFDFVIPGLLIQFGDIVGILDESRRLHHFDRIHRGWKNNGDERVWMQRDRRGELLQIGGAALGGGGRRSCGRAGCHGGSHVGVRG